MEVVSGAAGLVASLDSARTGLGLELDLDLDLDLELELELEARRPTGPGGG